MQIFFSSNLVGDSHSDHCRKFDGFLLQYQYRQSKVGMIQVVTSKERWSGDLLPETLQEFGQSMIFSPVQVCKRIMRTDGSVYYTMDVRVCIVKCIGFCSKLTNTFFMCVYL